MPSGLVYGFSRILLTSSDFGLRFPRMTRTEKLHNYSRGRTKVFMAETLDVSPRLMTYLLRIDIDKLITDIDALPVEMPTTVEVGQK